MQWVELWHWCFPELHSSTSEDIKERISPLSQLRPFLYSLTPARLPSTFLKVRYQGVHHCWNGWIPSGDCTPNASATSEQGLQTMAHSQTQLLPVSVKNRFYIFNWLKKKKKIEGRAIFCDTWKWYKIQILVSIDKILLECHHSCSFMCWLCLLSHYNGRIEKLWQGPSGPQNLRYLLCSLSHEELAGLYFQARLARWELCVYVWVCDISGQSCLVDVSMVDGIMVLSKMFKSLRLEPVIMLPSS